MSMHHILLIGKFKSEKQGILVSNLFSGYTLTHLYSPASLKPLPDNEVINNVLLTSMRLTSC